MESAKTFCDSESSIGSERTRLISSTATSNKELRKARILLYTSHTFNQFSESAWQFAIILFLAAFSDYESLFLISSYGLASTLSVVLLGSRAGRLVDDTNRLQVARYFIWIENIGVLLATALSYWLLRILQERNDFSYDLLTILILVGIHFFGSLASVLDKAFLVAVERDWVVVMSEVAKEENGDWLSETNVAMKQIDLSCKVIAPAVAGFVIGAFDHSGGGSDLTGAAILVGSLNVVSLIVEYVCMVQIYSLVPSLSARRACMSDDSGDDFSHQGVKAPRVKQESRYRTFIPRGLKIYMTQPVCYAGFSLALLYLNALTFGGLMTGYLVWRGMHLETVGVWRGISAAVGLIGTFVYHFSTRRTTLVFTGMWSVVYQFVCISLSFASLFVEDYNLSIFMLISGTCASRVGLWVFDITVTQLMQEFIPEGIRGVVGGSQQSLNAFFQLLSFALGLIFPDPRKFHIYVSAGYGAVGFAMLLYMLGIYRKRETFLNATERSR